MIRYRCKIIIYKHFKKVVYLAGWICIVVGSILILLEFYPDRDQSEPDGLIPVCDSKGRWGFINQYGKVIHPFEWEYAQPFGEDGLAWVRFSDPGGDEGVWGAISPDGSVSVTPAWRNWDNVLRWGGPNKDVAWLMRAEHEWVAINRRGEQLFERSFREWPDNFDESGISIVAKDRPSNKVPELKGGINLKGELVIPFVWSSIHSFDHYETTNARSASGEETQINKQGEVVGYYSRATSERIPFDDREVFEQAGKFGLKKINGEIVFPTKWDAIWPTTNKVLMKVELDGKFGAIDKHGNEVIQTEWDSISASLYGNGIIVKRGGKHGFFSLKGEPIVRAEWPGYVSEHSEVDAGASHTSGVVARRFGKISMLPYDKISSCYQVQLSVVSNGATENAALVNEKLDILYVQKSEYEMEIIIGGPRDEPWVVAVDAVDVTNSLISEMIYYAKCELFGVDEMYKYYCTVFDGKTGERIWASSPVSKKIVGIGLIFIGFIFFAISPIRPLD